MPRFSPSRAARSSTPLTVRIAASSPPPAAARRSRRLVRSDGIEATLERLARQGIFLTLDEAKGRCPVVRGSLTFTIDPRRLANPVTASHLVYRTSGSRGAGTIVSANVGYFRDRAVNVGLCLDARGGGRWRHAL